jgi:LysR family glycine cleavage system transcriptional activator
MIAPRRFLPSVSSLVALEAVDRLGSAMAASAELSLTHSAVSRQLKVLEQQLGVALFYRSGKGLVLSPAGVGYAQTVRRILQDLARASLRVKAGGSRNSLNLAVLPAFGKYWLGPHLFAFMRAHPDILVNQSTRTSPFDFEGDRFDAAIHFGRRDWSAVGYLELAREQVMPVCAPGFAASLPMSPQDLITRPLLHLDSRPGAWEQWFLYHGYHVEQLRGLLFDQFASMADAAAAGVGVALLPEFICKSEIAAGRLVGASGESIPIDGAYYLVWPLAQEMSPALEALIAWLSASAGLA